MVRGRSRHKVLRALAHQGHEGLVFGLLLRREFRRRARRHRAVEFTKRRFDDLRRARIEAPREGGREAVRLIAADVQLLGHASILSNNASTVAGHTSRKLRPPLRWTV